MKDKLPNRQSIQKKGWDYRAPGWYFVTINARKGQAPFGRVVNGRTALSEAGGGGMLAGDSSAFPGGANW